MKRPPLLDQRPLMPMGSMDCFESCLWMVAHARGVDVSIIDILTAHAGATEITAGLVLCHRFGLPGAYLVTSGLDPVHNYVIALIHDDNNANPDINGPNLHYVVAYDQRDDLIYCINPWGGRDIAYPILQFNQAFIEAIVIPGPPPSPPPGEEPMTPAEKLDLARGVARLAEQLGLLTAPTSDTELASIANDGVVNGIEHMVAGLLNGALGTFDRAAIQQLVRLLPDITRLATAPAPPVAPAPSAGGWDETRIAKLEAKLAKAGGDLA